MNKVDKEFKPSVWAIGKSNIIYFLMFIFLALGINAYNELPREDFPEIVTSEVFISTINPGNTAEDIERFITSPLEEAVKGVSNLVDVTSTSLENYSIIRLEFDEEIEIELAKQKVRDLIDSVISGEDWPTFNNVKVDPDILSMSIAEEMPILNINLVGDYPTESLKNYAEILEKRIEKLDLSLQELDDQISAKKNLIEEAKALMKKYTEQQKNVRNNREFDSLTKETEYQELEIQLAEKNIKEFKAQIELKNESIETVKSTLSEKTDHLKHKKGELDNILKETEKEENMLLNKSEDYKKLIEERLLFAYGKIRSNVKNGLAIVPIERGAAGGSYFTIPPQVQMEIASRKKIITDEHSGRILVDEVLATEQKEKMEKLFSSI